MAWVLGSMCFFAAPESPAAPGDDWSLERDRNDPQLAKRRFDKLLASPFDAKLWRTLRSSIGLSGLDALIKKANRAPGSRVAATILQARLLEARGNHRAAADTIAPVASANGRFRGRSRLLHINLLESAGDYVAAIDALERLAADSPKSARKSLARAYELARKAGPSLATRQLALAKRLLPNNPTSSDFLRVARAASAAGDQATAHQAFADARHRAPPRQQPDIYLEWARAKFATKEGGPGQQLLWDGLNISTRKHPSHGALWDELARASEQFSTRSEQIPRIRKWLSEPAHARDLDGWRTLASLEQSAGLDVTRTWAKILELDPRDTQTHRSRILALEAAGDRKPALDALSKLRRASDRLAIGIELANQMITSGDREEGLLLAQKLASDAGRSADAHMLLIDFFNLNEEPDLALKAAQTLVKSHPRNPDARILLGEQLMQLQREQDAYREWAMLPKLIRPAHRGWARQAEVLSVHNRRESQRALKRALELAPDHPEYLRLQALAHSENRVPRDALKVWQRLLEKATGPKHRLLRDEARNRVVDILVGHHKHAELRHLRKEAEKLALEQIEGKDDKQAIEAGLFLAELYTREERYRQAVYIQLKLVARTPDSPERLASLALSQRRAGMGEEALNTLDKLMKRDPKRGADILAELSDVAFASGDIDRLLAVADRAQNQGADSTGALLRLGELQENRGKVGQAEETYRKLLERNPNDTSARLRLAELALTRNQLDQAEEMFFEILERGGAPDVVRAAGRRVLDLAEAKSKTLEVVAVALDWAKRSPSSAEAREFLLAALQRTEQRELKHWLGLDRPKNPESEAVKELRAALIRALARAPIGERMQAAEHLGHLELPGTAPSLARIGAQLSPPRGATHTVQNTYRETRATALWAAGKLDDKEAIGVFSELLRQPERRSLVRYASAWALARSEHSQATQQLRGFLKTRDDSLLTALACIATTSAHDPAAQRADRIHFADQMRRSRSTSVRHVCALAYAAASEDSDYLRFIRDLNHEDPVFSGIAAWRLGRIDFDALTSEQQREVVTALFRRYFGASGLARNAAVASLARILSQAPRNEPDRAKLPPLHRKGWGSVLARWLRAEIAPPPLDVSRQQLMAHRPALRDAIKGAKSGTRAEREAVKRARLACGDTPTKICLYPLFSQPFVLSPPAR